MNFGRSGCSRCTSSNEEIMPRKKTFDELKEELITTRDNIKRIANMSLSGEIIAAATRELVEKIAIIKVEMHVYVDSI